MDDERVIEEMAERLMGRYVADDVVDPATGEVLVSREQMMNEELVEKIRKAGIKRVKIRSIINCCAKDGVCAKCYGANLATDQPVAIGEAVGIIAAQSIGELGARLADGLGGDIARCVRMIKEGKVTSINGKELNIKGDTLCVHGDGPKALAFVQKIRSTFAEEGIEIKHL